MSGDQENMYHESEIMEAQHPVRKLRMGLELAVLALVAIAPLVMIVYAWITTDISKWELLAIGGIGTLLWWILFYFAFWLVV
jgi:hypothetical protein